MSSAELTDQVADKVLSIPGVLSLYGGTFNEIATYLPGRRVSGIRTSDDGMTVQVVAEYGYNLPELATSIQKAVTPIVGGPVSVTIGDVKTQSEVAEEKAAQERAEQRKAEAKAKAAEMRDAAKERANQVRESVESRAAQAAATTTSAAKQTGESAKAVASQVAEATESGGKDAREAVQSGAESAKDAATGFYEEAKSRLHDVVNPPADAGITQPTAPPSMSSSSQRPSGEVDEPVAARPVTTREEEMAEKADPSTEK